MDVALAGIAQEMLEDSTPHPLPASLGIRPHALQLLMARIQLGQGARSDYRDVTDCDPEAHARHIQATEVEGVLALGGSRRGDVVQVGL